MARRSRSLTSARTAQAADADFSQDPVVALVEASVYAAQNEYDIPADLKPSVLDLDGTVPDVGDCEYFEINRTGRCVRAATRRGQDAGADRRLPRPPVGARAGGAGKRYGYTAYFLVREGCPSADVTPWMVQQRRSEHPVRGVPGLGPVYQVDELDADVVVLGSQANRRGFTTE